nr:shikimate kinase [uncultured Anaerotignum sp.]
MEKELACLRSIIADCDERITAALKTRMECIEGIITYKRENGLPVLQPEQEKKQLARVAEAVAGSVFEEEILHIFEGIIANSKRIQAKTLFDKNILLIGFMGAGKSTVSAKLSELLAMEIMEMDAYIQKKEGMSIKDIFATNGEEYFRNCESNTLIELRERKHMVVSCGGGVPLREKNVELMKNSGYVVWLTATPEAIYERVKDSTERPLLNGNMNVPFIQNLMESRREKYERAADIVIDTTGKEIESICEELLQKLSALRK